MRYLHLIASLDPESGGPAEGVRQICAATRRLGHEVEVATLDPPGEGCDKGLECPVHELGPPRFGMYSWSPRLKPWLRQNAARFGAVIVNGLWQYHGYAAWQVLRHSGTPYFVYPHGMLDPWFRRQYPLKHLKKWLYWPWAEYRVLRDARSVLFTCEEEQLLARDSFWLYRANEAIVSYGTPGPGDADAGVQREAFLRRFPQLRGKRLLLFLGRLHEKKGCDMLIDAFAEVVREHPALHLVMAGPDAGNMQHALSRRAAADTPAITWTGMLRGDEKWGAFRAAEAFVLPSHQENFGIAVAEAMACRTPVLISSRVNIWREIVQDGAGLVGDDTPAGTRGLLQRWLESSAVEREDMAAGAQRSFMRRFHVDAAAARLFAATAAGAPHVGRQVAA
ncbi:MAG TPA: glycosyltransferase [Steroidobacteraceae bacterium]|nr:glycosyltransferase [Steroidobacteraceae bacterium]